jgi:hypothetical protein
MKIEMFLSGIPSPCTSTMKAFHSQLAINGIPLKLALFFVVIVQARNDGSIGVLSARSSIQRITKSAP